MSGSIHPSSLVDSSPLIDVNRSIGLDIVHHCSNDSNHFHISLPVLGSTPCWAPHVSKVRRSAWSIPAATAFSQRWGVWKKLEDVLVPPWEVIFPRKSAGIRKMFWANLRKVCYSPEK